MSYLFKVGDQVIYKERVKLLKPFGYLSPANSVCTVIAVNLSAEDENERYELILGTTPHLYRKGDEPKFKGKMSAITPVKNEIIPITKFIPCFPKDVKTIKLAHLTGEQPFYPSFDVGETVIVRLANIIVRTAQITNIIIEGDRFLYEIQLKGKDNNKMLVGYHELTKGELFL